MYSFYTGNFKICERGQCKTYDKGIEYQVFLKSAHFPWMDFTNSTEKIPFKPGPIFRIALKNLPYAYTDYEVSVRLRVTLELNHKFPMQNRINWGEAFNSSFRTLGRSPDTPPKTDLGSFYLHTTDERVRLYFEHLPVYNQNGPDFHYEISEVRKNGIPVNLHKLNDVVSNATFTLPWQRNNEYEYFIKSCNAFGKSEASSIKIPRIPIEIEKTHSPTWIRSIYHPANRSYTISWIPPINRTNFINYTVFWCEKQHDCQDDTLHFDYLDENLTEYSKTVQDVNYTLTFAVSANYANFSTGLHWNMCTAKDIDPLEKMVPDMTSVITSREIEIRWSLVGTCTSLPEGFTLIYCEIGSANSIARPESTSPCLNGPFKIAIDKANRRFVLNKLIPFTFYKIEMFMFSRLKNGTISDAQFIRTKEDAPSPPQSLKANNITSNSVSLSWNPPKYPNGLIRSYLIDFNNQKRNAFCSNPMKNICEYTLVDLTSFMEYKIYVKAQTIAYSGTSNDVNIRTLIGIPSSPRHMAQMEKNRTILEWGSPQIPAGRNDFYEVAVTTWNKNELKKRRITAVYGSNACEIKPHICSSPDDKLTLEVRAVNVAKRDNHEIDYGLYNKTKKEVDSDAGYYTDDADLECVGINMSIKNAQQIVAEYSKSEEYVLYKSAWEKGTEYACGDIPEIHLMAAVALIVVLTSLTAMITFFFAHRKCESMKISVRLPGVLDLTGQNMGNEKGHNVDANQKTSIKSPSMDYRYISKESLFHQESHRLLSSAGLENGYLGRVTGAVNHMTPCSIISSGYDGSQKSCDYLKQEAFNSLTSDGASSADTVVTPLEDDGYKLMAQSSFSENTTRGDDSITKASAYVKPNTVFTKPPTAQSIDYVQPHMLLNTQPAQVSSYTTVQSLNKPRATLQPTMMNDLQAISGYVTHKQLSAFGQQKQQQLQHDNNMTFKNADHIS